MFQTIEGIEDRWLIRNVETWKINPLAPDLCKQLFLILGGAHLLIYSEKQYLIRNVANADRKEQTFNTLCLSITIQISDVK